MATGDANLRAGEEVHVFYRMNRRCMPQRKYLAVLDPRHGAYRPRTGMSDGWVPARVVCDHDPAVHGGDVQVEYRWPHFFTQRGHATERESGWTEWYSIADVWRKGENGTAAAMAMPDLLAPRDAASRPELALLTFRWGGWNEISAPEQWGSTGSSVSDIFIDAFVDSAVIPQLGNSYEVWTVYVEDHSDMLKIANSAHLIFGPHHPLRRAKHVCAMYHLYPTSFEENCVPNRETGEDSGAALVDQKAFFQMMKSVERAGIPSRFPHCSGFYELLASKRWTYAMALVPHLKVPATVAMPRMIVEGSRASAAAKGLAALEEVRKRQAELGMRSDASPQLAPLTKGVAKLGFSWEALDVKFWQNRDGLEVALEQLTQAIELSQEMTGQPHEMESIILQEYIVHDFEARFYVVDGKVETTIFTKFCKIKDNNEFGDFKELFTAKEAATSWMGNDQAAMAEAMRQCEEVTRHWMGWVVAQTCETPPAIRFDYFVKRGDKPGQAVVWTLEICELGFSMLGEEKLPAKVFAAMLKSCLGSDFQAVAVPAKPAAPIKNVAKAPPSAPAAKAEAAPAGDTPQAPAALYIKVPTSPDYTSDQSKCTGKYQVMPVTANGQPVWINSRGDRFLYFGNDSYWYVGDEEEQDQNFDCDQGYMRHVALGDTAPTNLGATWERGPDWVLDDQILVSVDANATTNGAAGKSPKHNKRGRGRGRG